MNVLPIRILHLDDHLLYVQGIRHITQKISSAIATVHCTTNSEALEVYLQAIHSGQPFHLILTDINHPNGDGLKFCRQINMGRTEKVPIGIISMLYNEPAATAANYDHVRNLQIRQLFQNELIQFVCSKTDSTERIRHLLELNLPL